MGLQKLVTFLDIIRALCLEAAAILVLMYKYEHHFPIFLILE